MTISNKLQKTVDRPVWEWLRFNPVGNTAAGTALCTSDDGSQRYMYFVSTTTFWRYDTITDGWQALAAPLVTAGTSAALKYSVYGGYRGKVLAASSTSITVPGLRNNLLAKKEDGTAVKVRIMSGTGAGQERTVTSIADAVIAEYGNASAGSTSSITDSTKLWKWNQWKGYQVRITTGAGLSQVRKILYNSQTVLYLSDVNFQPQDPFGNALLITAAAAGSVYQIESSVVTVPIWTTTPDTTSTFAFMTGGVWYVTTAATAPASHLAFYDIHSDVWYPKTVIGGNTYTALGTDWSLERTGEIAGAYYGGASGIAATNGGSNTARTFTDTAAVAWTVDQWAGYQLRISVGTAAGQRRRIVGNTATVLTVEKNFDVTPGATDTYQIFGDTDKIYLSGSANSSIYQYSIENDIWSLGPQWDTGICRIGSVQHKTNGSAMGSQEPFGLTSIVYNATGITAITGIGAGGTGYTMASIGAIVTFASGVTGGSCIITGVVGGAVTSVELVNSGTGGSAGTYTLTGGVGSGATATITVGKVGLVTTATNHNFKTGETVLITGAETDTNWNGQCTILGVSSQTVFSIAPSNGAAGASATFTGQSSTLVRDTSKSWTAHEHIGRLIAVCDTTAANGSYSAWYLTRISDNTTNALTVATMTAGGTNGVARYVIFGPEAFGRDEQFKVAALKGEGYATAGGASTLTDSTKTWLPGQWVGYKVRIICGTGLGNEQAITANTSTQLTVASWGVATPDTTSKYIIMDTYGAATGTFATTTLADSTKNWATNALVGKRVKILAGIDFGQETIITGNTATVLTMAPALSTITTAATYYQVLGAPVKGTNPTLQWLYNTTAYQKGKYMLSARGNSPYFDLYDIARGTFDFQMLVTPQIENLVLGSMFAYDGADRVYFTVGATGRVLCLDLTTNMIQVSGITPYAHGTGLAGNRMEIITTTDGLDYLYIMRHTGAEMWRTLVFWSTW